MIGRRGRGGADPDADLRGEVGFGALLRTNADVRRLWGGTVVSLFGDWFNTLALYRLVLDLTGSETALGGVFLTKLLPLALASPVAGVLADRLDRRKLMIGADLVRAAIVLGFLFVRDAGDLWLLYVLASAQIAVSAAFTPAKNAVLPAITKKGELLTANALLSATWSIMLAVGAAAGGPAVDAFGTDVVFWLDAATYLVSAAFIARVRVPPRAPDASGEGDQSAARGGVGGAVREGLGQIVEGWRYLRRRPAVGRIALAKATWSVGGGGLVLALALIGDRLFPSAGTTGIGVLFAARGLGTGLGPILARALFRDARRWPAVLGACVVASAVAYAGVAVAGDVRWAIVALVVLAHAASGTNWVLSTTLLHDRAEDRYRGRVFATDWLLATLVQSVSIVTTSVLLESGVSVGAVILGLAAVEGGVGLLWLATVVPAERAAETVGQ
ncbi:MFS transporter [Rubrivirga sp. S365]|uniref:MFS transporter n=1 Tax=Rubrivirga sp. S365 TaxID=3076080 RepID=UPI0028CAC7B0|nr:MFS transporter [Rubrivirga sp. S365]MDT7857593.1 MFS transporter [Rubrivirga sp. S365]